MLTVLTRHFTNSVSTVLNDFEINYKILKQS